MDWSELWVPVLGALLCCLTVAQLGFWAAQSWQLGRHQRQHFELANQLLRQQLELTAATPLPNLANATSIPAAGEVAPDGTWSGFRAFRVAQLVDESPSTRSIYLKPADGGRLATFQAGQYVTVRYRRPGSDTDLQRCYSLSNGPGQDGYRISVKRALPPAPQPHAPPGVVSQFLHDQLRVGDTLDLKSPRGKFVWSPQPGKPTVLLAGGVGITPMISFLQQALASKHDQLIVLFYGVRNRQDHPFKAWLEEIASHHANVMVITCYSQPGPADRQGIDFQVPQRLSVELVAQILPDLNCQFYICGPGGFSRDLGTGLQAAGVSPTQIHSESFGSGLAGKIDAPRNPKENADSGQRNQVQFVRSEKTIPQASSAMTLLELAEAHQIPIESECRAGDCGTCVTRLLSGNVAYPEGLPSDCPPDHCLPCVAQPRGAVSVDA